MKVRSIAASCVVCLLISLCATVAFAQRAAVTPRAAGHTAIPLQINPPTAEASVAPASPTWTKGTNAPPASVGAMLLLTDGRVLVHSEPNCNGCTGNYSNWWTLTPDNTGSYVNGTWKQVASLPPGYSPLYMAEAVMIDGRVVIEGGEYNFGSFAFTNLGAGYDPVANTWTMIDPPAGWGFIGDSPSAV